MARGRDMHTAPQHAPPGHFGTVEPGDALPCFENSDLYAFLDRLHDLRDRLIHWHAVALGTVAETERHRPGAAEIGRASCRERVRAGVGGGRERANARV